eukprot:gene5147-6407_t
MQLEIISLILSTVIGSIVVYTIDNLDECFIDEFGWSVFLRGSLIDIVGNLFVQFILWGLYHPRLLWKSKPYQFYTQYDWDPDVQGSEASSVDLLQVRQEERKFALQYNWIMLVLVSVCVGIVTGLVQYGLQYYKIKLQFHPEKILSQHRPMLNKALNGVLYEKAAPTKGKFKPESLPSEILLENHLKDKCLKQWGGPLGRIIYQFLVPVFKGSTVLVLHNILYYTIYLSLFTFINYIQFNYHNFTFGRLVDDANVNNKSDSSTGILLFLNYIKEYFYFRSPFISVFFSSIFAVILTQPLNLYNTQLQAINYAHQLLVEIFVNNSSLDINCTPSHRKEIETFQSKLNVIYNKSSTLGFIGRLLYQPLYNVIITLWFDYFISIF